MKVTLSSGERDSVRVSLIKGIERHLKELKSLKNQEKILVVVNKINQKAIMLYEVGKDRFDLEGYNALEFIQADSPAEDEV